MTAKQSQNDLERDTVIPPLENRIEEKVKLTKDEESVSIVDADMGRPSGGTIAAPLSAFL